MKWSLILTSLLVSAALATTDDEPETTTSRLHRSTFQEQLQWTTPLPTTASLPTESESATVDSQVDTETESTPAVMDPRLQHRDDDSQRHQQKPDMLEETTVEKVTTNLGVVVKDDSPIAERDHEEVPDSSSQNGAAGTDEPRSEARGFVRDVPPSFRCI